MAKIYSMIEERRARKRLAMQTRAVLNTVAEIIQMLGDPPLTAGDVEALESLVVERLIERHGALFAGEVVEGGDDHKRSA